jgi:ABC-type sugar transport system ATPase subunit
VHHAVSEVSFSVGAGEIVGLAGVAGCGRTELLDAIFGARTPPAAGQPVLSVRDLRVPGHVHGISMDVAPGEIVGLTGLVGAGRTHLLEALFGRQRLATGDVEVDGVPRRLLDPVAAIAAGVSYVPDDRRRLGLVLGMSIRENLMMAATSKHNRLRRPSLRGEGETVARLIADLGIVARDGDQAPVGSLSGGNQQKVVLGRSLATNPRVLLLNEPTRGVDIGAKGEIHRLLQTAAARGLGIVVSSSETPELLGLCDRILVLFRGRVAARLDAADATEARILHYATGQRT